MFVATNIRLRKLHIEYIKIDCESLLGDRRIMTAGFNSARATWTAGQSKLTRVLATGPQLEANSAYLHVVVL